MRTYSCIKCGGVVDKSVVINGKTIELFYKRKYCLVCVPYGENANRLHNRGLSIRKCARCGDTFSTNPTINGRKVRLGHYKKYCLKCVPFGESPQAKFKMLGKKLLCNVCHKYYIYDYHGHSTANKCRTCISRENRNKIKLMAVQYKGGKCVNCGWNMWLSGLTFHHLDPKRKDFSLGHRRSLSWKLAKREVDKCILLCMNCHSGIHSGDLVVDKSWLE